MRKVVAGGGVANEYGEHNTQDSDKDSGDARVEDGAHRNTPDDWLRRSRRGGFLLGGCMGNGAQIKGVKIVVHIA